MRIIGALLGFLCVALAIWLNVRPIPSEVGKHYSFWDRTLPMSLVAVVVGSVLLLPRKWILLSLMFAAAAVLVRVMTYFVLAY